jgi:hypothetical protein
MRYKNQEAYFADGGRVIDALDGAGIAQSRSLRLDTPTTHKF